MSRKHCILLTLALAIVTMRAAPVVHAGARAGAGRQAAANPPKGKPAQASGAARTYAYALPDGKKITLDFPLFVDAKGPKVTKDVFRGYTLYNSYCYRCHGTDATESELAPNIRQAVSKGLTTRQFLAVALPGRPDKGMPSWAGFLSAEEMTSIYRYVKGRSLGLVPVGRPASEFD